MTPAPAWARAAWAVRLLALDPGGLGGIWLRARAGPVRDRFMAMLARADIALPARRIHPAIPDEALFGGLDIAATLARGRPVTTRGILAEPALMILPMAERTTPGLAARLGGALDQGGHALVALDEGAEPEEALPAKLTERLAFHVSLEGLSLADCPELDPDDLPSDAAPLDGDPLELIAGTAAGFGIGSLRAPLMTLAAARMAAALAGREDPDLSDLQLAVALVLAPRARQLPPAEAEDAPAEPPPEAPESDDTPTEDPGTPQEIPREILLEAVRAALPPGLLDALQARMSGRGASGQSAQGQKRSGNRRGRPLPSRPGRLGGDARLDLVASLRNAAPWQPLRRRARPGADHVLMRMEDIRLRRYESRSDRALIFVVDASGSTALARLAEAKGAIETLLAGAYARRDHVALIAFRGTGAELLLPPTRSLVQTRRRLAALPGGGGTPLAAGLRAAFELARQVRARGMDPGIALLTDGRANIGLDAEPGRARAMEDASAMARALRAEGTPSILIDTAVRPQQAAKALAHEMGARYIALPGADAARLSGAVSAALA